MEVACHTCGKHDDALSMYVCADCFSVHFCSEEHFAQSDHATLTDELHLIQPNFLRTFKVANFQPALSAFLADVISAVYAYRTTQRGPPGEYFHNTYTPATEQLFLREFSKSNHTAFRNAWNTYTHTVSLSIERIKTTDTDTLEEVSKPLIEVFAKENRLSFRQTKSAIAYAFYRWNRLLLRYTQNVDPDAWSELELDLRKMIPSFSRVLGGGRKLE